MGNHASHSGESRHKEGSGPPSVSRFEGNSAGAHRSRIVRQQSEEEHEPSFIGNLKSPDNRDEAPPVRYRPSGNKKMLPCVLKWHGGGQKVNLSGGFNQWQKIPMVKSEKDFVAIVDLPEGKFEYKFEVDGDWKVNETDEKIVTEDGIENNIIVIQDSDIAELENELLKDPNDLNAPDVFNIHNPTHMRLNSNEDEGYGQKVPEYRPNERFKDPPVLPPHLLQVILNKDTPVSCEPTLLPEPNHVIVNHMYALSIRDGMMVLSTTHRYKKKSVTTLIYRPI